MGRPIFFPGQLLRQIGMALKFFVEIGKIRSRLAASIDVPRNVPEQGRLQLANIPAFRQPQFILAVYLPCTKAFWHGVGTDSRRNPTLAGELEKCKFALTSARAILHIGVWPGMAATRGPPRHIYPTFQLVFAATMGIKSSPQYVERARRFALHLPVYFRQPHGPTWLEGTTENVSHTGLLFHSSSPLAPETALELRLQLAVGTERNYGAEIRCKGAVVRVEQRNVPETPIALAVAIRDYRIVRRGHV